MVRTTKVDAPAQTGIPRPDAITLAAFAGVVLIAGSNPVAVRETFKELDPLWSAAFRFFIGSLILFAIARARHQQLPRGRALAGAVLYGLLAGFGAYGLIYKGLEHVPASLAAPVMASVPLITFFLAAAHRVERFRWRGLAGGVISVAGIVVLSNPGSSGGAPVKYLLLILGASLCVAEAGIVVKKFPHVPPFMMNAIAMGVASVLLFLTSLATSESLSLPTQGRTWVAFAFLVLFGSVILFVIFIIVLTRWTVTGASYQFVLFPLVAVLLASWIASEPITRSLVFGGLLVLLGVYVGALSGHRPHLHRKPRPETSQPAAATPLPPC